MLYEVITDKIDDAGQLVDRIRDLFVCDPESSKHRNVLYLILVH